jgi:hypothetical protein
MQPMSYSLEEQPFGNFLKFKVIKASAPLWSVKSEVVLVPQLCSIWSPRTNIYLWCQGRMEAHFQHIKVGPSSQATTNLLSNIKARMAVESPKARPARLASRQAFPATPAIGLPDIFCNGQNVMRTSGKIPHAEYAGSADSARET